MASSPCATGASTPTCRAAEASRARPSPTHMSRSPSSGRPSAMALRVTFSQRPWYQLRQSSQHTIRPLWLPWQWQKRAFSFCSRLALRCWETRATASWATTRSISTHACILPRIAAPLTRPLRRRSPGSRRFLTRCSSWRWRIACSMRKRCRCVPPRRFMNNSWAIRRLPIR